MGIQDRDYYQEHVAGMDGRSKSTQTSNSYADALRKAEASSRSSEDANSWGSWLAWSCLIVFILIACAAVWLARR